MQYNFHEPIYQNIEKEVAALAYEITFDDDQMSVYSVKIAELILRVCTEIESISKELYNQREENLLSNISYQNAINELGLNKKIVIISSLNNMFSDEQKILLPFKSGWDSGERLGDDGGIVKLGGWNYAYQTIKHDKTNDKYIAVKRYGTIKYLLDTLAALYILNIEYTNNHKINSDIFDLVQSDNNCETFRIYRKSQGTIVASIEDNLTTIINQKLQQAE